MKFYLTDKESKDHKIAIKYIRRYLRQLESALKSDKVDIKELEINNHIEEIGDEYVNRRYNPTGRRTLKIIYYEKMEKI